MPTSWPRRWRWTRPWAGPPVARPAAAAALRVATARDQLVRIAHDWPRLLPGTPDEALAQSLVHCPLGPALRDPVAQQAALAALPAWLEKHWLGLPAASGWPGRSRPRSNGPCTGRATPPPRWPGCCAPSMALRTPGHAGAAAVAGRAGGGRLPGTVPAARQLPPHVLPQWQGAVPDTGPWTRRRDSAPACAQCLDAPAQPPDRSAAPGRPRRRGLAGPGPAAARPARASPGWRWPAAC
jgi:hypothetical protein